MLLVRKGNEGIWIKHTFRGAEIKLKIRPADPDVFDEIRKRHTKKEYAVNPFTKQMEKLEATDNAAVMDDTIDYLLEDFEGVGEANDEGKAVAWPTDRDHKIRLCNVSPLGNEPRLWEFILAKANEFRTITEQEKAELEKK